ncbi:hypothetical protein [Arvimicrobium flavum]|uniref:hypothetical protein n=1 Tax=Arvimicrobium flavum TaxID=3393320 RepID=UPI00237BE110|nr:hypothetical protein [Mesorhizobium shangrilense]
MTRRLLLRQQSELVAVEGIYAPVRQSEDADLRAALRCHPMVSPWIIDAPMNRAGFETYVETHLAPELRPGDVVLRGNVAVHKAGGPLHFAREITVFAQACPRLTRFSAGLCPWRAATP